VEITTISRGISRTVADTLLECLAIPVYSVANDLTSLTVMLLSIR
jgi:hypothetical protein